MTGFLRMLMNMIKDITNGLVEPILHTRADDKGSWLLTMELREKEMDDYMGGTVEVPLIPFYREFQKDIPVSELAERMVCESEKKKVEYLNSIAWCNDWYQVKDRITYRLVNPEQYGVLLKERYCVPVLDDMSVIFYIATDISKNEADFCSLVPVTNEIAERWNRIDKEILAQAIENMKGTKVLYELSSVKGSVKYYSEIEQMESMDEPQLGLLVATNKFEDFGANVIMDNEWLKNISRLLESDLYIIAPTVHQATIQSARTALLDVGQLKAMAESIKISEREDGLSDSVYYFGRMNGQLQKVA